MRQRFAFLLLLLTALSVSVGGHERRALAQPAPSETRPTRAFGSEIRFHHLTTADGLPHADVHAIHQDSLGFLWFGTEDGLARYDGREFRVYRPVPFDTTSPRAPWTVGMAETNDGRLWITSEEGTLERYDPRSDTFSPAPGATSIGDGWVTKMAPGGTLWIGGRTQGLYRYDPSANALRTFRHDADDPSSLSSNLIAALLTDQSERLWVGTREGGLDRLDSPDEPFIHFRHDPADAASVPDPYVSSLLEDREGRLWVGTLAGLARYREPDRFEPVDALRDDAVWSLLEDPAGHLWAGTSRGLVRFDPATGATVRYTHDPANPASLSAGDVRTLFLDRSGTVWAATETGLSAFRWAAPPFEHLAAGPRGLGDPGVWSILRARDGTLWVGTESGLDHFDGGNVTRFRDDGTQATISPGWVVSLYEDEDRTLWVGTRRHESSPGALHQIDPRTGRVLRRFVENPSDPASLPSDNPWRLREDRQGRFWVLSGGSGCPSVFDRTAGTFEPHCLDADPGGERYVAKSFVEDADGTFWFGTWGGGLFNLDTETGVSRVITHDPSNVNSPAGDNLSDLAAGDDGVIWIGTYGAGLSRFDTDTGQFTHYSTTNSDLPNDVVYSIEIDDVGNLWLSSNAGLTRLEVGTETFETFGLDDGVQDLEFNAVVSHQAPDGSLYFGGINGLNRFDPTRIQTSDEPLKAVVTRVLVNGVAAEAGGTVLEVAAPYARAVHLGARERDVAFDVTALGADDHVQIRYRLDGYDEDWHTASADRRATYTNLNPGDYTFRVQTTSGSTWSDGVALRVGVTPRFYQTWWFRLLAGLALVGAIGVGYAARIRDLRQRKAELEAEVADRTEALLAEKATTEAQADQLRELDRAKNRFFANVSHEFRTPLTLTIGPLEDLRAGMYGPIDDHAREPVDLALKSSRRVLSLINQILDVAKQDARDTRLRARHLDLRSALDGLAEAFAPLAERLDVTLVAKPPPAPVRAWVDAEALDTILSNLLSNAFKFTPAGGTIHVSLTGDDDDATITVADTGPGITSEDLPHVFDRFYQAETSPQGVGALHQPGTGIGLSLARELATLHGGTLTADSVVGEGATFTLRVPLGREHLTDEQIASDQDPAPIPWAGPVDHADADAAPVSDIDDGSDRTTVLVVDDHAGVRSYVRRHLEDEYRVLEAADGEEALAIVRESLPDLVVSDVTMPILDGVSLCQAVKSDPATDFIPVLLLTARAAEEDIVGGLGALADAYITKPFNVRELSVRIAGLIEQRRRLKLRWTPSDDGALTRLPSLPAHVSTDEESFVESVLSAIDLSCHDPSFGTDDLASAVGVSRSVLYRKLGSSLDQTPAVLLRDTRLARAHHFLHENAGSVTEIAYAVGFRSVSTFSRSYRQQYGTPPSEHTASRSVTEDES